MFFLTIIEVNFERAPSLSCQKAPPKNRIRPHHREILAALWVCRCCQLVLQRLLLCMKRGSCQLLAQKRISKSEKHEKWIQKNEKWEIFNPRKFHGKKFKLIEKMKNWSTLVTTGKINSLIWDIIHCWATEVIRKIEKDEICQSWPRFGRYSFQYSEAASISRISNSNSSLINETHISYNKFKPQTCN